MLKEYRISDNKLTAVNGGIKGGTSAYDIGQRVRYDSPFGRKENGTIRSVIFYGSDRSWAYRILPDERDVMETIPEERIVGTC